MTRPIAAIDIGTNSVLMLLCRRSPRGGLETIADRARITRLGRGVDKTGRLDPAAVRRTLDALAELVAEARVYGASIHAVGTSALRDARMARDLLEPAARLLGTEVDVIDGQREAELCFEGALFGLPVGRKHACVVDIGGGSTEIVRLQGTELHAVSLDMGAVRFTERYGVTAPTDVAQCRVLEAAAVDTLASVSPLVLTGSLIAAAGTATTLAAIAASVEPFDPAAIHGVRLSVADLDRLIAAIAPLDLSERGRIPGLDPGRADIVVTGACILRAVCAAASCSELLISCGGLRVGLAQSISDNNIR